MFSPPLDLSNATILVTNDDGIRSPGLETLERIARQLSSDVWTVAPEVEQSATSHSLTITRPLRLRQLSEQRFAVDGTPTDCVLLAINHVMKDRRPALVLSGINLGFNIGDDVTYSGTIAAAMEATLLGVPAIALSQSLQNWDGFDWRVAERYGPEVIEKVTRAGWADDVLINVNFPSVGDPDRVAGVNVVRHGKRKIGDNLLERTDPRGRTYFWIGVARDIDDVPEDTDIARLEQGGVTVTPLSLDLNHRDSMSQLERVFS